jgi:quercetin dioxygenase-like cupin family protein
MIRAGFETTDPRTGTRSVVIEGAEETGGRGFLIEVHCPEGARAAVLAHLHTTWTEEFEILRGAATCRLGGEERALSAGESIVMPPRLPHVHPWNSGSGEMLYRQRSDFGEVRPEAVGDVLGVFATLNALAGAGKVDDKGLPKNFLQLAAALRTLTRHGGYDAKAPIAAQRLMAATLGRFAELLGYRGADPRLWS